MSTKRSQNFSKDEVAVLVNEVERRKKVIFGRHDQGEVTNQGKKRVWEEIAETVSNVTGVRRDIQTIKKKWSDVKSLAKKKAAKCHRSAIQTGGGPPAPRLDEVDEKVVSLLGTEAIQGVPGGIDSTDVMFEAIKSSPIEEESHDNTSVLETGVADDQQESWEVTGIPTSSKCPTERMPQIKAERLAVEKERLAIEKERLQIEKSRLEEERARRELEERRLHLEEQRSCFENICREVHIVANEG